MPAPSLVKRIRYSLWTGSVLVVLLVASIFYVGVDSRNKLEGIIHDTRVTSLVHRIESDLHTLREHELGFFVEIADPAARSREQGKWASAHDDLDKTIAELRATGGASHPKLTSVLDHAARFSKDYGTTFERISSEALSVPALDAAAIAGYEHQMANVQTRAATLFDAIDNEIAALESANEKSERQIEREMMISMAVSLALGAIVVLMLIGLSAFVPTRLNSALKGLSQTIDEVSLGKRYNPVGSSGIADFYAIEQAVERLRISVNGMLQRLMPNAR